LGRLKQTPDSLTGCKKLAVVVVGGKGEEKEREGNGEKDRRRDELKRRDPGEQKNPV